VNCNHYNIDLIDEKVIIDLKKQVCYIIIYKKINEFMHVCIKMNGEINGNFI